MVLQTIDLGGAWRIRPAGAGADASWRPIRLPCASQTVLGADFHDAALLRRRVAAPSLAPGERCWLRFESVATRLAARVDGVEVGVHVGDWVPYQFEVTDAVAGKNDIEIELDVDELHGTHVTKGFHDVLSLAHGGVWQPLDLCVTGDVAPVPDGIGVTASPETGLVRVDVELERRRGDRPCALDVAIVDPDGETVGRRVTRVGPRTRRCSLVARVPSPRRWSPADPALYTAVVEAGTGGRWPVRFGFRRARADDAVIRLNGAPLFLRGVLDWGHEPRSIAPAPTPAEVRARFATLRALGFNCVCLCMWYAPRWLYDIADETGMLIWQQHPVWQSPMRDADLPEYERLYRSFMRRDRNHPSVVVVSATCEHPRFHPRLAQWWWTRSADELPGALRQVQTASFAWADADRTDLHDEHTYENCDRWPAYLHDVQRHLDTLPPRPFVMGETMAFSVWPDLARVDPAAWWRPRAHADMIACERSWAARHGEATVERFRRQSRRHALLGRKRQMELFRRYPRHAGLVMNHLRDVPACQCGLLDDDDRARLAPRETRGWLGDAALLLWTPGDRRAFRGGRVLRCRAAVSRPGRVRCARIALRLPAVDRPVRQRVILEADGLDANAWDLWLFPDPPPWPPGATRLDAAPFAGAELEPDDVERGYSRGFGLPARRWRHRPIEAAELARELPASGAPPRDARVVLTHRLTPDLVRWLADGGRVLLLASKGAGGLGTSYEWLFGQAPLVVEEGPLAAGDAAWIVDLLGRDLTRTHGRVIPVEQLGIAGDVAPLIRCAYTHDQKDRVRVFDHLFSAAVGDGLLVASSLDLRGVAGRWLLRRTASWLADPDARSGGRLAVERVTALAAPRSRARPTRSGPRAARTDRRPASPAPES